MRAIRYPTRPARCRTSPPSASPPSIPRLLNENQFEQNYFGVAALQRSINGADVQVSYFTRYSSVHFIPDPIGDIVFNGVASDVFRSDIANGVTTDAAYRLNEAHTLRGGFLLRTDLTDVANTNTLLPVVGGAPVDAPFTVSTPATSSATPVSFYVQDEWRITNWLILSSGLRYDQYWAYISENQFSPRFSLTWKPFDTTTFHAGYARTFTPPEQVLAAPTNLALVQNTTQQPSVLCGMVPCGRSAPTSTTSAWCSKCCQGWRSASTPTTRTLPT